METAFEIRLLGRCDDIRTIRPQLAHAISPRRSDQSTAGDAEVSVHSELQGENVARSPIPYPIETPSPVEHCYYTRSSKPFYPSPNPSPPPPSYPPSSMPMPAVTRLSNWPQLVRSAMMLLVGRKLVLNTALSGVGGIVVPP